MMKWKRKDRKTESGLGGSFGKVSVLLLWFLFASFPSCLRLLVFSLHIRDSKERNYGYSTPYFGRPRIMRGIA